MIDNDTRVSNYYIGGYNTLISYIVSRNIHENKGFQEALIFVNHVL